MVLVVLGASYLANRTSYNPTNISFTNTVTICSNSTRGSLPFAALSLSGKYKGQNKGQNKGQTLSNTVGTDPIPKKRELTVTVNANMGAEPVERGPKSAVFIPKLSQADEKLYKVLVLDPKENNDIKDAILKFRASLIYTIWMG
jgi:hypothetical protein